MTAPTETAGTQSVSVSVSVDANHCNFYAICVTEAPEVFELRSNGRLRYAAHPAPTSMEAVLAAARLCPMQAIHVEVRRAR